MTSKQPLNKILKIRKHKEQAALARLMKARRELQAARRERDAAARQLAEFIPWRKNEEKRLFDKLKNKVRNIHDLNRFNQQAEFLKQREDHLAGRLDEAEKKVSRAASRQKEAKQQYNECYRKMVKIETMEKIRRKECLAADERKAEDLRDEFNTAVDGGKATV